MPKLSIIIPVFNEADSLESLLSEIKTVAAANDYQLEIIFVDDGSTDESWEVISRLAATEKPVRALRFRKNFGKATALRTGIDQSVGEYIITLDGLSQSTIQGDDVLTDRLINSSLQSGRFAKVFSEPQSPHQFQSLPNREMTSHDSSVKNDFKLMNSRRRLF